MGDPMGAEPIREVLIVGGGTAGWMAAAAAARFLDDGRRRIRLVESDAIGTVGVGESTIPTMAVFNQMLGIAEADFLRATRGTFKLGIEFVGWGAEGERYFHGFGPLGRPVAGVSLHQLWLKHRRQHGVGPLQAYSMSATAAAAGRFAPPATDARSARSMLMNAYHIDAGAYAGFLRRYAEARGLERLEGRIVQVERGHGGGVAAVLLDGGERLEADLFLDCSGFRSLLLGDALGTGFVDWSRWLPCDRAVALPSHAVGPPPPFTRASASPAGWRWRIPLQHRTGNGHVYSSAHMADDEAEQLLREGLEGEAIGTPNRLGFRAGRREEAWRHNVVAIGLSAGFLEPLESTSIHLIQYGIQRLFELFPDTGFDPAPRHAYNRLMQEGFEAIRDFVILHYRLNRRPEPFWTALREVPLPDTLQAKLDLFAGQGRVVRYMDDLFEVSNWVQVMVGQGLLPAGHDPLADGVPDALALRALAETRQAFEREALAMPAHAAALAQIGRGGGAGAALRPMAGR
jgi:tryptophan 7-halogenase